MWRVVTQDCAFFFCRSTIRFIFTLITILSPHCLSLSRATFLYDKEGKYFTAVSLSLSLSYALPICFAVVSSIQEIKWPVYICDSKLFLARQPISLGFHSLPLSHGNPHFHLRLYVWKEKKKKTLLYDLLGCKVLIFIF